MNYLDEVKKLGPFDFATCGSDGEKLCLPIVECGRWKKMHKKYREDFLSVSLDGNGVFDSGAISGSPEACRKAFPLYIDSVLRQLRAGFIQDDQPYWVDLGLRHPELAFFFDASSADDSNLNDHWKDAALQVAFAKKFKRDECVDLSTSAPSHDEQHAD